jgi:hypothetical protein
MGMTVTVSIAHPAAAVQVICTIGWRGDRWELIPILVKVKVTEEVRVEVRDFRDEIFEGVRGNEPVRRPIPQAHKTRDYGTIGISCVLLQSCGTLVQISKGRVVGT